MGQKINPIKFRIQHTKDWRSRWFASNRKFATSLNQDIQTRNLIEKRFEGQAVIDRIRLIVHTKWLALQSSLPSPEWLLVRAE